MRIGVSVAILAAALLCATEALAACPAGSARNCVNLDLAPQISQQIAVGEQGAPGSKAAFAAKAEQPYTGLTVGVSKMMPRAATVGYRWSID